METTLTIQARFFMDKDGNKLTLPEIIAQDKKITYVIIICPPEKIEIPVSGIKGKLGFKKEAIRSVHKDLIGDIKIDLINDEFLSISMPFNEQNIAQFIEIRKCESMGIKKEFNRRDKEGRPIKFEISIRKVLKLGWE